MHLRSLRTSLATFAALCALGVSGSALAQGGSAQLAFYPAQSWTIAAGDAGTCRISNSYNNGYALSLDHSANGSGAMAIDFQQNIFEAGQSYDASLSIPGSPASAVAAVASGADTLSFDVGALDGFYERLSRSGVLDVAVEGNNFRFFMTGFGAKAGDLAACAAPDMLMDAGAPPVSVVEEPAVAAASLPDPTDLLQAEPMDIAPAEEMAADVAAFTASPAAAPAPASNRLADIERVAQPAQPPAAVMAPAVEIEVVEEEVLTPPENMSVSTPEFKVTRQTAQAEIDIRDIGITPAPQRADLKALQDKVRKLERENASLQKDIVAADTLEISSNYSISSDNWDLERATMRYQEAERQLKLMGQKLQRERAQCVMEQKELENMLFDPELTSQQQLAELAALEQELAKAQEDLISQRVRYEERIKLLEKQIADF